MWELYNVNFEESARWRWECVDEKYTIHIYFLLFSALHRPLLEARVPFWASPDNGSAVRSHQGAENHTWGVTKDLGLFSLGK